MLERLLALAIQVYKTEEEYKEYQELYEKVSKKLGGKKDE